VGEFGALVIFAKYEDDDPIVDDPSIPKGKYVAHFIIDGGEFKSWLKFAATCYIL